jgi:hypothetical protein
LTSLLNHPDDDVAIAAIAGLRKLGAIDEQLVSMLEPLVLGARVQLRIAAAEALASSAPSALSAARALLSRVLTAAVGSTTDVEDLVVVVSRVLLAIGGNGELVAERWKKAPPVLRTRLEALLRRHGATGR